MANHKQKALTHTCSYSLAHSITLYLPLSLTLFFSQGYGQKWEIKRVRQNRYIRPGEREKGLKRWDIIQSQWWKTIFQLRKGGVWALPRSLVAFKRVTLILGGCSVHVLSLNSAEPWCDQLKTALVSRVLYALVSDNHTLGMLYYRKVNYFGIFQPSF